MRWPYFEPITEPGRGGDSPDTPRYKARRLIVEEIKKEYFASLSLPQCGVWYDREVVPIAWLNGQLENGGHRWCVRVVDDEYEFFEAAGIRG
jgi:hypothetical protein